ncbi:hypothetical protein BGZ58_007843 [Dissophora ornata]|nr:hypothetical protein BGZ58_007843 [Dissophora ornata]
MFAPFRNSIAPQICKARAPLSPASASSPLQRLASIRFLSTRHPRPLRDASYPFPLYYHLVPPHSSDRHSSYAVSFLADFPNHNRQVIGYLSHNPSSSSSASGNDESLQLKPNKFTENGAFNNVLHAVIQQNLDKDPMVETVLHQQSEGWTHIVDYRNPAPYGRIPSSEDIFGSVQIVDGVIQPSTYQRMPSHRIVSGDGLFQLSEYLHEKLVHHLKSL